MLKYREPWECECVNKDFEKRSNEVFEVLAILAKLDKQIVFLGGSAIQAILPEQKRLSIDLDISYFGETDKLIHELQSAGYSVVKRKGRNPIFVFYTVTKKDVMVKLDMPEEKGTDIVESTLSKIPHVSSVTIEDYRRAFG